MSGLVQSGPRDDQIISHRSGRQDWRIEPDPFQSVTDDKVADLEPAVRRKGPGADTEEPLRSHAFPLQETLQLVRSLKALPFEGNPGAHASSRSDKAIKTDFIDRRGRAISRRTPGDQAFQRPGSKSVSGDGEGDPRSKNLRAGGPVHARQLARRRHRVSAKGRWWAPCRDARKEELVHDFRFGNFNQAARTRTNSFGGPEQTIIGVS